MTDYIYDNAPVVEVLAELRWEIQPIQGSGLFIDEKLEICEPAFIAAAKEAGFGVKQSMIPRGMPIPLFSHRPTTRIRQGNDTWPLYQIGPGIFTANMVPSGPNYDGWRTFKGFVRQGIQWLYETYPESQTAIKVVSLQLTYINALRNSHGSPENYNFLSETLKIAPKIPDKLKELTNNRDADTKIVSEIHIPVEKPANTGIVIKFGAGQHNQDDAIVFQNTAALSAQQAKVMTIDEIMSWFEDAHKMTRQVFESVLEENLTGKLGNKKILD